MSLIAYLTIFFVKFDILPRIGQFLAVFESKKLIFCRIQENYSLIRQKFRHIRQHFD